MGSCGLRSCLCVCVCGGIPETETEVETVTGAATEKHNKTIEATFWDSKINLYCVGGHY